MIRPGPPLFLALTLLLGGRSAVLRAEAPLEDWHVHGSNTLRASHYGTRGLAAASPYAFEGDMYFNEMNINLLRQDSPYDFWRGEFSGVLNFNDDYRSLKTGIVPERINLTRESGSAPIPFRLELGDHFAYLSYLTLQRSLKGLRWELQPVSAVEGRNHSLVFISGLNEPSWRDISRRDDYTNAFSWLVQDVRLGTYGVNFAQNYRRGSTALGTLGRNQHVISLVGEKPFKFGMQDMVLEAELARFSGDHDGTSGPASGQGVRDSGAFVQFSGLSRKLPWDYQLRYQSYGQHFRPRAGIITPDRRSWEGFTGWRFDGGTLLRLRAQSFLDFRKSANPLATRTVGLNLTGPLLRNWWPDMDGSLDIFAQRLNDRSDSIDQRNRTLNLNLSKPLDEVWTGRLGLFVQRINDTTPANADRHTAELRIGAGRSFSLGGFDGYFTPGIMLRTVRRGGNSSNDVEPTLALQMIGGPHMVNFDLGSLSQNRLPAAGVDVQTYRMNFGYSFTRRQHVLGLEANLFGRNPSPGASTDAHRVSVFWTYNFDKPPASSQRSMATAQLAPGGEPRLDLAAMPPGLGRAAAETVLGSAGATGGTRIGRFLVFDFPLQRDILLRQRLVLEYDADVLERSALVIDFGASGDPASDGQVFEKVRQQLIRLLGNPGRSFDRGEFGPDFPASVNNQRLQRITEWLLPDGSIVRYGLPRRLDGQVRMEIQRARSFPPPNETRWSIEEVR